MKLIKLLVSTLNRDLQRELNEYIGISEEDRMKKCRVIHHIKQLFANSDIYGMTHRLSNIYIIETFEEHWFGCIDDEDVFEKGVLLSRF
jgi:hypothetical protein